MADALEFEIEAAEAGERVDRVLAAKMGDTASRAQILRWIKGGFVKLDGEAIPAKKIVREGMLIVVQPQRAPEPNAVAEDIEVDIVFEDEHLLIVNKASGMVVHPAAGHPNGTLVNALLHHVRLPEGDDELRPGIVHRLDKDTSGIMVVAKSELSHRRLVDIFRAHDIEREYRALCFGRTPKSHRFDTLHGRHPVARKKFSSKVRNGKRAITDIETLAELFGASEVACRLHTGRTHQIRVHLSESGYPILADPIYGRRSKDERLNDAAAQIGRLALHAYSLGFLHPISGEEMKFVAEPPADFMAARAALLDHA